MIRTGFLSLVLGVLMVLPASAAEPSLAGLWEVTISSPQGTRVSTLQLAQSGSEVTGTYKSPRSQGPVTGHLAGNQFELAVVLGNADNTFTLRYVGTLEGDAISGTLHMGSRGEIAFTGKRGE
jgi:hypothetical protein